MIEAVVGVTAIVAVIFGGAGLIVACLRAFIEGDLDGLHPHWDRSEDSLLYGPIREVIYQFAFARQVARQERIEAIKAERKEKGSNR
jgi:hypothetical protein